MSLNSFPRRIILNIGPGLMNFSPQKPSSTFDASLKSSKYFSITIPYSYMRKIIAHLKVKHKTIFGHLLRKPFFMVSAAPRPLFACIEFICDPRG
jgi:hypothetical protein